MAALFGISNVWGFSKPTTRAADRTEQQFHAFEAMVARDWDRFYRYAYRLCASNADDAEDLLSESLIDAFRSFDRYRGEGFDRWVFSMIAHNRIDMARRKKARRGDVTESLDTAFNGPQAEGRDIADESATPEHLIVDPLYSEPLQCALDALPEEFRAVILLCDVEEMDYKEIAETLNIPIGTVRSRIHRARAQMRRTLEAAGWRG